MSKIEWTDVSWNPVTGCTKISAGCQNCYAERMTRRQVAMAKARASKVSWGASSGGQSRVWDAAMAGEKYRNGFRVTCHPDELDKPLHWKKPRKIFVCSMSDLFHGAIPASFVDEVFATMALSPQHTFQIPTKRPKGMCHYLTTREENIANAAFDLMFRESLRVPSEMEIAIGRGRMPAWPLPNVHLLTSVENQETADERIPHLLRTPAATRGLSLEPLLGPVDLDCINFGNNIAVSSGSVIVASAAGNQPFNPVIDWVIVGGETGPGARPMDPDWARDIRDQCKTAGVPFFFKAMGGGQPTPKDLMIREFPNT